MPLGANRFPGQAETVPRSTFDGLSVSVIGVGAIGRQVAMQLAALGTCQLRLVDFDQVKESDVRTQGYTLAEYGQAKVAALAAAIAHVDPGIHIESIAERYHPTIDLGEITFCCVDSADTSSVIWRAAGSASRFWCDGRIFDESVRILTVTDTDSREYYSGTFLQESGRTTETSPTSTPLIAGYIAAGLMLHQFTRWLRGVPTDRDLSLNLSASELSLR